MTIPFLSVVEKKSSCASNFLAPPQELFAAPEAGPRDKFATSFVRSREGNRAFGPTNQDRKARKHPPFGRPGVADMAHRMPLMISVRLDS